MKTTRLPHRFLPFALALLVAGCAELPKLAAPDAAPKAAAPQITEETLRDRARGQLAAGVKQYDAGEFDGAQKNLTASLDHGLLSKVDQSRARKLLAFIHCASGREAQCRDEFRKAFEINPEFSLSVAEDGHPIWGPVYRNVRTQLVAEREAAQQRKTPVFVSLGKAEQLMQDGMIKYDAGDFAAAEKLLKESLAAGIALKADKVRAMKHLAFSLCLQRRWPEGRKVFMDIYDIDPEFDLTPAEAGHPEWRLTFAGAKAQAKREIAAKEQAAHAKAENEAKAKQAQAEKEAKAKQAQAAREKAARERPPAPPVAAPAATPKKN